MAAPTSVSDTLNKMCTVGLCVPMFLTTLNVTWARSTTISGWTDQGNPGFGVTPLTNSKKRHH